MLKRILSLFLTLVMIIGLLPVFSFSASAASSYTLDVGDTQWLSFSSGDKAIISSFWETNAPSAVAIVNSYLTSCQIEVMSYTELQPVIGSCTYYYQELIGNYIYNFSGYEDFRIRINPSDCTVYLDPCGGSVSPSYVTVTTGSTYGTLPTPTRSGCTFDGWYTSSSGGSRVYSSTTVTATRDHTLYAHWDYDSITVTFDPNGGAVDTKSKTVTYDSTYGTLPTPVREGFGFIGWFTAAEGGSRIKSSSYVTHTSDHTLYAHWCLNHSPVTDLAVAPTCTKTGLTEGSHCDACGTVLVAQQVVPMIPHTPVKDRAVPPTCTGTGLSNGSRCDVCGTVLEAPQEVPVISHTPIDVEEVDATCEEPGWSAGTRCVFCDANISQTEIPALGHNYVDDVCTNCGEPDYSTFAAYGTCGNDTKWTLDEEGLLHIFGTGAITKTGWRDYKTSIKRVVIGENVTYIPNHAFASTMHWFLWSCRPP